LGRVSLNLTVNNLFNERYFTASGNAFAVMPGEPRTISLRAGISL
jgi:outer membrane receptor protein involved in Fe transport